MTTTQQTTNRYELVTAEKAGGATYTPKLLADFVAVQMIRALKVTARAKPFRILDPAVGEGELLSSLLRQLPAPHNVEVYGFDTDEEAVKHTTARLKTSFPGAKLHLRRSDFLRFVLANCDGVPGGLFETSALEQYDMIIANPPYVRTQIMGGAQARKLAAEFGLAGRVDLYYAFLLGMSRVLAPEGVAGIIVSNRFMTTRAGATVRAAIRASFSLRHVWDLGDTKLFDAAVLPAVLLAEGCGRQNPSVQFTSVYETRDSAEQSASTPIDALGLDGVIEVSDGRRFRVQQGSLDSSGSAAGIWRIKTRENASWLATVADHTWSTFGDVGKIRVGVKTCADDVFVRTDWHLQGEKLELLRPVTTHHIARRFRAETRNSRSILYPHESVGGRRRPVDLALYPRSRAYLEKNRTLLEGRTYVTAAGRQWYEIWVPQDPAAWQRPKLVFRDISDQPCFWIDREGSVVNGDCYWMIPHREGSEDLLWLAAAVGNSTFIEAFYDHRFNNKLYAGRRRFITQYVEQFPLPDPTAPLSLELIAQAKTSYAAAGTADAEQLNAELDQLVWKAFGLRVEEVSR